MAAPKNATRAVYLDTSPAHQSLQDLEKKAESYGKSIEEAKRQQQQLISELQQARGAAKDVEALQNQFAGLGKKMESVSAALAKTNQEQERVKKSMQEYADKIAIAEEKQRRLNDELAAAETAGKSTVRLKTQLKNVGEEISVLSNRYNENKRTLDALNATSERYAKTLDFAKKRASELKTDIKDGEAANRNIDRLKSNYHKLQSEIDQTTQKLRENKDAQNKLDAEIKAGIRPSLMQQEILVRKLRMELRRMSEDAPGYAAKFESFQKARAELERMSMAINGVKAAQKSWFEDAKTVAFGVLIANAAQTALASMGNYFSGIISGNAKLSDSFADIQKTTGMSLKEVTKLNKELNAIDTRTSTAALREIAYGLGQIGEMATSEKVAAIDQIVVSLGDEFGTGPNEITKALSVLRNNLRDLKTENYAQDVTHIGNALNILGQEGLATAPVVVDIANRISGIGQTFKISSGEILGVAATFQELGISAERGSTAMIRVLQRIGANPEKFAKAAGMSVEEFTNLVNTNMLQAFVKVTEGAKKAGESNIEFSRIIRELNADGSGAGEVFSKLGANSDLLAKKVNTATEALKGNDSILDEFNKKNTNLAAQIEKLQRAFLGLIQAKSFVDIFSVGVSVLASFLNVLKAIPKALSDNKAATSLLILGILTLNASYIKASALAIKDAVANTYNAVAKKASALATAIATAAQASYIQITNLLIGRITVATAVQRLWNIAMSLGAGPIGALIIAAGALVYVIGNIVASTNKLSAAQKLNREIQSKVVNSTNDQVNKIKLLKDVLTDNNVALINKQKALKELIAINPDFQNTLKLNKDGHLEGAKAIEVYINSLKQKAEAEAQMALFNEKTKQKAQLLLELNDPTGDGRGVKNMSKGLLNDAKKFLDEVASGETGAYTERAISKSIGPITNKLEQLVNLNKQIGILQTNISATAKKNMDTLKTQSDDTNTYSAGIIGKLKAQIEELDNALDGLQSKSAISANRKKRDALQKELDALLGKSATKEADSGQRLLEELKAFKAELERVGKSADESEIHRITTKYNKLIAEATRYGISYIEIEKEKNRAIAFLEAEELRKRREKQQKDFEELSKSEYQQALVFASEYYDGLKDKELEKYKDGLLSKSQYEDNIKAIDAESRNELVRVAEDYAETVKQAADDVNKFKKQKRKEDLKDEVADYELRVAMKKRADLARAETAVMTSMPGTEKHLQAQLKLLEVQREQALMAERLTEEEKEKIRNEFRIKEAETIKNFYTEQINQTLDLMQQSLSIVGTIGQMTNDSENAAFRKEQQRNAQKRKEIERLAKQRIITEIEARRQIAELDKKEDKRKEEIERKQFERNKKLQIAQAIVNGAMAITSTLAARPGALDVLSLGTFRAIQIALTVATTAAQIASISAQKYALGGKVQKLGNGRITAAQNVPEQDNGDNVLAFVRQNEVILNEQQQAMLGGADTFRRIGVPGFAGGGRVIKPFWETRPYRSLNIPAMERNIRTVRYAFADGGRVGNGATSYSSPLADKDSSRVMAEQQEINIMMVDAVNKLSQKLSEPIGATVSLKQLEDAKRMKEKQLSDGAFR